MGTKCSKGYPAQEKAAAVLSIEGREVRITNPQKPYFTKQAKLSKLEIVQYYLAVAGGALGGIRDRPVDAIGIDGCDGRIGALLDVLVPDRDACRSHASTIRERTGERRI